MIKSKRRKIIIAVVLATILTLGLITTIILLTRDRWEMEYTSKVSYNEHKNMHVVSIPTGYTLPNNSNPEYYSNGTVKIKNANTSHYGVFSFIDNRVIIPDLYGEGDLKAIPLTVNSKESNEYIFKTTKKVGEDGNRLEFYTDEGERLSITEYDAASDTLYGFIKTKFLNLAEKRKGIKVTTKNKFTTEKIEIQNAEYIESFETDEDNYELWKITAANGTEYINLYESDDEERELIQTINNNLGQSLDLANSNVYFLKDGTPRIYTNKATEYSDHNQMNLTFFNTDLKEKGDASLNINDNLTAVCQVGDSIFLQYVYESIEDEYDFYMSAAGVTEYFNLKTYAFNLKNGRCKQVNFDYLITGGEMSETFDGIDSIRKNTILLYGREIDNKTLLDESNILINDDLDINKIDYDINTITKITDDRYLAYADDGQYLIDENYKKVCYLGKFNNIFTTEESVILNDSDFTYICTLDGVLIKKYNKGEITNANDKHYYIVNTKTTIDGVTYTQRYLERLGVRQSTPLVNVSENSYKHTYAGKTYIEYNDNIIGSNVGIVTRVRESGKKYSYDFYNLHGKLLLTLDNFETTNRPLTYWGYTDNDHMIVHIATNVAGIEYYIVVDR